MKVLQTCSTTPSLTPYRINILSYVSLSASERLYRSSSIQLSDEGKTPSFDSRLHIKKPLAHQP